MSIATKRGDNGTTGLPGGFRVSQSDRRVDAYGTVDQLISAMGFARAICPDEDLRTLTKELRRELFKVGSAIATPPEAAYDVARTICRRAERLVVALIEEGKPIQPTALAYLNRLSDLLWLFGRVVECRLGLDSKLRTGTGPRWSRAW